MDSTRTGLRELAEELRAQDHALEGLNASLPDDVADVVLRLGVEVRERIDEAVEQTANVASARPLRNAVRV